MIQMKMIIKMEILMATTTTGVSIKVVS